ncbi:MAG: hypothetical protein M1819_002149 [Sarea resinae]|nr:MAG: hypothetical protein M1819_002149 [Sarea resinae]
MSVIRILRPALLQSGIIAPPVDTCSLRNYSSAADISALLQKPTWSVRSLVPKSDTTTPEISSKQLNHLLRLSALPPPETPEEEEKMLSTLRSQLHFVKEIQSVDTEGVEPLQSIRDETLEAEKEAEISLESLKEALAKEERTGRTGRIRRRKSKIDANEAENWDVLGHTSRRVGKYFIVESGQE